MGKFYCSECGTELDDSVKFCSSCGTRVDNEISENTNNITKNNSSDNIMERIEIVPLITGIIIVGVIFFISELYYYSPQLNLLGLVIGSFIMGYLCRESIIFVMIYGIIISIVHYLIAHFVFYFGTCYTTYIVWPWLPLIIVIISAFVGNLIRVKLKI